MNEEQLKVKRLKILTETAEYYNSSNRGILDGECSYRGGCAIGRFINQELAVELDMMRPSSVDLHNVFNKLPEELKELGQEFLYDLQGLHDNGFCWNELGITERGQERVEAIKKLYSL